MALERVARQLRSQRGFSVVEVLIAATIFVVGFTIVVGLLDRALNRLSQEELESARILSGEVWHATSCAQDTTSLQSQCSRDGRMFMVEKSVTTNGRFVEVSVHVRRAASGKEVIHLCNAFVMSEK